MKSGKKLLRKLSKGPTPRITLTVLAVGILAAAWAALFMDRTLDAKDPSAVAGQFVNDMQDQSIGQAYSLTSQDFQKKHPLNVFSDTTAPTMTRQWPVSKASYYQTEDIKQDEKTVTYIIPSDGRYKAQQVRLQMVRQNGGADWYVNNVTSITHIGGRVSPGAM